MRALTSRHPAWPWVLALLLVPGCLLDTSKLTGGEGNDDGGLGGALQSPDGSVTGGYAGNEGGNAGDDSGGLGGGGMGGQGEGGTAGDEPVMEPDSAAGSPAGGDASDSGVPHEPDEVPEPDDDASVRGDSGVEPPTDAGNGQDPPGAGCSGAGCRLCDGTCTTSGCEPRALASGIGSAESVDRLVPWGETLFYSDLAADRIVQLQPLPLEADVIAEGISAASIILDADNSVLYLYDAGGPLRSCALDGDSENCTSDNVVTVINELSADRSRVVLHDSDVLLFDMISDQYRIVNCNDNCRRPDMQAPIELFQLGPAAGSMYVTQDDMLFATGENIDSEGRLFAFDFASNERTTFSDVGAAPDAVFATDTHVYWLQSAINGAVWSCTRPECGDAAPITTTATIDGSPITFPSSLVTVGSNVYWTNETSVMRCDTESCDESADVIMASVDTPTSIVASGQCLFWVDAPGTLWTVELAD